jgi:hypothetical protein
LLICWCTVVSHHQDSNEKTPRFPENDEEKAGFSVERLRWELNPRWRICNPQGTNENTGNPDVLEHLRQHSESTGSKNTGFSDSPAILLSVARESITISRHAVEKLLDSIPPDDHYSLGILGSVLVALRESERDIGGI